jgi:DNA-binding LacI/PurR family transcriptional regulator
MMSVRSMAKLLNLSHATVSLALRDSHRVAKSTREAVRKLAEEVGYRHQEAEVEIAWINAGLQPNQPRPSKDFDGYWRGASAEAEKSGYRLEEFRIDENCSPKRLHQILSMRGIHDILLPSQPSQRGWNDFPWHEYSVVRLGLSLEPPLVDTVAPDYVANARLAFNEIRKRGYRRIGFVTHPLELASNGHLFGVGYIAAQQTVPPEEQLPIFELPACESGKRSGVFREWLEQWRPDAIFTDAYEIRPMLEEAGIKAPEDIGLAVTNITEGGVDSGLEQCSEEIGRNAFMMLNSLRTERLGGDSTISRKLVIMGNWVNGSSLPIRIRP